MDGLAESVKVLGKVMKSANRENSEWRMASDMSGFRTHSLLPTMRHN